MTRYLDVLGRVFSVPDPDSVAALSASYRTVAVDIGDARSELSALASPQAWAEWTGPAADAFAQKIGGLPHQLEQAWQSYSAVAWALADYAGNLQPVVQALSALVFEAENAEGALRATTAARNQVIAQGQDPEATGWNSRLWDAEANVVAVERRLSALLNELDALAGECVNRVRQAQAEGIQNNAVTDVQRYVLMDGGTALAEYARLQVDGAKIIWNIGDDLLVQPLVQFGHDFNEWRQHPSWETFGVALGAVGGLLGLAALLIPGLGEFVAPVLAAALIADAVAAEKHEPGAGRGQLEDAGFEFALAGVGSVLQGGVAASKAAADLPDGADAQASGAALLKDGVTHTFSMDELTSPWPDTYQELEKPAATLSNDAYSLTHVGVDLDTTNPAAVTFQHVEFGLGAVDDIKGIIEDQHEKGQLLWQ
jgi:hypothetical protein